jgi:hypothetical protein
MFTFVENKYLSMGVIKELRECSIELKSILIGIGVLACYWAGIFYVYHKELFQLPNHKFYILLLVPSILWYAMEWTKCVFALDALETALKFKIPKNIYWLLIAGDAVIYLILFSIILFLANVTFKHFIYLAFFIHLLFMLAGIGIFIYAHSNNNRTNEAQG